LLSDIDLVFDSAASLTQTLVFDTQPDQDVTLHLDMANDASNNGVLGAGWRGHGSLAIRDGVTINSDGGYIGYLFGSMGVVTVDGADSTWTNGKNLHVGRFGNGTLHITDGAAVSNSSTSIGLYPGSTGVVTVDGAGSTWANDGYLYVGRFGSNGTLNITGGAAVSNSDGYIAAKSGSTGMVTVDGAGSTWTNGEDLYVGGSGSATLNITAGAVVSSQNGYINYVASGPTVVVVTVDGAGSMWTNSGELRVGRSGNGTLNISGGAAVSATGVSIRDESLLAIEVGNGSLLQIDGGSGMIANDGIARISAGAGATAGNVYEPIGATTFSGNGVYQAVGGTWDETEHLLTVSDIVSGTAGSTVTIDRSQMQRMLIDDPQTGWSVGASFVPADAASELNVTATVVSGSMLGELESLLEAGHAVHGAWTFEVTGGYTAGDPAYLSFDLGPGFDRSDLNLWHYDGSQWAEFDAADLTCNGNYASFTVTGFSGYAVSAVPEPGTLVMLLGGVVAVALIGRRRRR